MVVIEKLKEGISPLYKKYRIAYVDAFGSTARSEQAQVSDMNLIIEFLEPRRAGISVRFFGFLHEFEDRFHHKVDLLTEKSSQNPFLKEKVDKDRVRIYGD